MTLKAVHGTLVNYLWQAEVEHEGTAVMFVSACSNINTVIDFTSVRHPWLLQVPSEMHPLQTRASGQGINVFFNFLASFFIGQFFNTMLCTMQVSAPYLQALSLQRTYALITCAHPSDLWHDASHTNILLLHNAAPISLRCANAELSVLSTPLLRRQHHCCLAVQCA